AARDHLQNVALRRAEGGVIDQRRFDVLVAAQRPEAVPLVEIQRRLLPHTAVDGIRIGVDGVVVRGVGEVLFGRRRHRDLPRCPRPSVAGGATTYLALSSFRDLQGQTAKRLPMAVRRIRGWIASHWKVVLLSSREPLAGLVPPPPGRSTSPVLE